MSDAPNTEVVSYIERKIGKRFPIAVLSYLGILYIVTLMTAIIMYCDLPDSIVSILITAIIGTASGLTVGITMITKAYFDNVTKERGA